MPSENSFTVILLCVWFHLSLDCYLFIKPPVISSTDISYEGIPFSLSLIMHGNNFEEDHCMSKCYSNQYWYMKVITCIAHCHMEFGRPTPHRFTWARGWSARLLALIMCVHFLFGKCTTAVQLIDTLVCTSLCTCVLGLNQDEQTPIIQ